MRPGRCRYRGQCGSSNSNHERDFHSVLLSMDHLVAFLLNWPYIRSSTNSTHLKSSNCASFSTCRYRGMAIFHGREKTLESSTVASYQRMSGLRGVYRSTT